IHKCDYYLFFTVGSFADKIGPVDKNANVVGKETDTVTLKCSYQSSSSVRLYWYKQSPHSAPQFLLYVGGTATDTRLEAKSTSDSTELTIRECKIIYLLFVHTIKVKCIMFSSITGDSMGDSINPSFTHEVVDEGDDVTLSCNYSTSATYSYLHWYRQHPRSNPEFILYIYDTTGGKSDSIPPRLDVKVDKNNKQVDLIISSAAVSDSGLYYCALAPTVTRNPAAKTSKL
ncbi:hypothetical protein C0J45_23234, partial [Silurus meridionalis]